MLTASPTPAVKPAEPQPHQAARPRGITLIAIVHVFSALLTVAFWILAFTRLPAPSALPEGPGQMNAATTYGFGIADFIWSLPFLLLAARGLWKMKTWGWLAGQMTNALWWYSLTVLSVRDLYTHTVSPGTIVFLPFTVFAFWAAVYLWRQRSLFFVEETKGGERRVS